MIAKGRVSIGWQIVFAIISPINLWAFYRIKKLQLFALYVIAPSIVISSIILVGIFYEANNPNSGYDEQGNRYPEPTIPPYMTPIEPQVGRFNTFATINIISSIGLTILSVYLVIIWSRQWNNQSFE